MTKKKSENGTTTNVEMVELNTALTVIHPQVETPEEKAQRLEAEVEKLKAKLSLEPQGLEERIEYYRAKQEKIKKLNSYQRTAEELNEHVEELKDYAETDELENEIYMLSIGTTGYNAKTLLRMQNPVLIGEVIEHILEKISIKIDALEQEIAM